MKKLIFVAITMAMTGFIAIEPARSAPIDLPAERCPMSQIIPSNWAGWNTPDWTASARVLPIPDFTAGGHKQFAMIVAGKLFVDESGPIQDLQSINWSDTSHGAYYSTQLHGLVGIGAVLREPKGPLEPDVAQKVGEHIRDWARCSSLNRDINPRAWYEGTVIKRLSNLLRALDYTRRFGPLGLLSEREIVYLIDLQVRYLLDTPDVYVGGNHGIRQDLLLAATAIHLPEHPRADYMIELAQKRLNQAARDLFSKEGIWTEHAPGYVNYAIGLIDEIGQLHQASEKFNPTLFLDRRKTSEMYLLQVLMPDGRIPYVGSSAAKEFSHPFSMQLEPQNVQKVGLTSWPDYGQAVVRGDQRTNFYLLFLAGQNLPAGKRHADELSFLLNRNGRSWITEGGHQSYERSKMTNYLRSPLAHNTYVHDGKYLREQSRPDLDVRIVEASERAGTIHLLGRSDRFLKQVSFERQIEITNFERLAVTDRLIGDGIWAGRLQLPGDLKVDIANSTVIARAPDGRAMKIVFASESSLRFSACRGEQEPICGWGGPPGEFGPATSLTWFVTGPAQVNFSIEWVEH